MLELSIPYFVPHSQCSNDNLFSCRTPARVGPSKLLWITLSHGRKQPKKRVRAPYAHKAGGGGSFCLHLKQSSEGKSRPKARPCRVARPRSPPPHLREAACRPQPPGRLPRDPRWHAGLQSRALPGSGDTEEPCEDPAPGSAAGTGGARDPQRAAPLPPPRFQQDLRGRPPPARAGARLPAAGVPWAALGASATRSGAARATDAPRTRHGGWGGSRGAGGTFPPGATGGREAGRAGPGRPGAPYLGPLLHVVLAEPAPAVHHQPVYQREEEVDGLAALLRAPDPLDLVAAEVPLSDAAAGAGQLPVGQLPVAVHPLHPLEHAVPHHLPQEVVQVAEADVVQAGHDVLQGDPLQVEPHDVPQRHGAAGTAAPLTCRRPPREAMPAGPPPAPGRPGQGLRRGAGPGETFAAAGWAGLGCAPRPGGAAGAPRCRPSGVRDPHPRAPRPRGNGARQPPPDLWTEAADGPALINTPATCGMCARPAARSRGAAARGWSPPGTARRGSPRPLPARHGPDSQWAVAGRGQPSGNERRRLPHVRVEGGAGPRPTRGVGVASAIEEFPPRMSAALPPPAPGRPATGPGAPGLLH